MAIKLTYMRAIPYILTVLSNNPTRMNDKKMIMS